MFLMFGLLDFKVKYRKLFQGKNQRHHSFTVLCYVDSLKALNPLLTPKQMSSSSLSLFLKMKIIPCMM